MNNLSLLLQVSTREMFNRDLLSLKFYIRKFLKQGIEKEIVSFFQTKFPYMFPLPKLPYIIGIEPTNHCNLQCIMCPNTSSTHPKGFMAMPLFRKIIHEATQHGVHKIRFVGLGEPLLHPRIAEMIQLAKKNNLYVELSTNATLLTHQLSKALIDAGLDQIGFSLDSADPSDYETIRKGADFYQVIGNVNHFLELCSKTDKQSPVTVARMVVFDNNDIHDFARMWAKKVDSLQFNFVKIYPNTPVSDEYNTTPRHTIESKKINNTQRCRLIRSYLPILWDGKVKLCNQSDLIIGNANTTCLRHIWSHSVIDNIRNMHRRHKGKQLEICSECNFIMPMPSRVLNKRNPAANSPNKAS